MLAIAWIMPLSLNPPMLVFSIRPERHSYALLKQTREFVVNIAAFDLAPQVLYCGKRSGKDVDKFKETGLTAGRARRVAAPIVNECVAHVECRVAETIRRGDHALVIGNVIAAYARNDAFRGLYDVKQFQPLLHLGGDVFTTTSDKTIEPDVD